MRGRVVRMCFDLATWSLFGSVTGCVSPITTPDQMRDAVLGDRVRSVRHAVRAGYPVAADVAYCFPLVPFAAATGHSRVLLAILDARANERPNENLVNQPNCMGHTALHFATLTKNTDLERELLARGADPGALDSMHRTPGDLRPNDEPHEKLP